MITVFSKQVTSRIQYIFKLYFEELLQIPVGFTNNADHFEQMEGVKLNYSDLNFQSTNFKLVPHELLFQKGIKYQDLTEVACGDQLCFFESSEDSFLPFDPFAAGFFLVSRYEEYLEKELDEHSRYQSRHSVLYRDNALKKPVVNQWALLIADKIMEYYPTLNIVKPEFDFLTTIDVDNAWAYKNKSLKRVIGASIKNVLTGDLQSIVKRLQVIKGKKKDPYDSYEYIKSSYKGLEDHLQFFFLLGEPGKYDRNVSPENKNLRGLIKELSNTFQVGIHPSYGSEKSEKKLHREINTLTTIIGKPVVDSRQHYLKLELPKTYNRLLKAGVKNDFTMGYADNVGFRAGIASPFFFYDLKIEEKTSLLIFPFHVMDVTMKEYLKMTPAQAFDEIVKIMQEVKQCGGTFISLWHNESLGTQEKWIGWRNVFDKMTELAVSMQNESV